MADVVDWAAANGFELTDWQQDALRQIYATRAETGEWPRFYLTPCRRQGWTKTRRWFAEIVRTFPG